MKADILEGALNLMAGVLLLIIGAGFGEAIGISTMKSDAIKAGVAHWEITTNGQPKFVWGGAK